MSKLLSLKTRIILQFLLIVSPFAVALLYQTNQETERAAHLARIASLLVRSDALKEEYHQFVNGVVDAVDSGRLSAKAVEALQLANSELQQLRADDPGPSREQAVKQLTNILAAVKSSSEIKALMPLRPSINELAAEIAKINQSYNDAIKLSVPSAVEMADQQKRVVLFVIILTVVITLLFVWIMIKGLTRPLRMAESVAQQIASGTIARTIQVDVSNEMGRLLESLVSMNSNLFNLLFSVKSAAASVSTSVDDIVSGNQEITRRSEDQANFLREMALWMKELASAVEQNIGSARQADELASAASKTVKTGDDAMSELVQTMAAIQESSAKIKDILGLVDDITRQTNILAHNATIEAARAGAAGRTFTVVAEQMTQLSESVRLAAQDIKTLTANSVNRAQLGNQQVERAGATMQEIILASQRVSYITAKIKAASESQMGAITHIKSAVDKMESMGHENRLAVEISTAASTELLRQERSLTEAVGAFDLREGETTDEARSALIGTETIRPAYS